MVLRLCAGNDNIHLLTSMARQKLRIDLEDFEGNTSYAEYDNFVVGSEEEEYKLWSLGTYNGTAGQRGVKTLTELYYANVTTLCSPFGMSRPSGQGRI